MVIFNRFMVLSDECFYLSHFYLRYLNKISTYIKESLISRHEGLLKIMNNRNALMKIEIIIMCLDDDSSPRPSLLKDIDFLYLYPETHPTCHRPCVEFVRKCKGSTGYQVVGAPWPINPKHADLNVGPEYHPWFVTFPVVASDEAKTEAKGCVEFEVMAKRVKKGWEYIWVVSVCRRPRISSGLSNCSCDSELLANSFDLLNVSHPALQKSTDDLIEIYKVNFPDAAVSVDTEDLVMNNGHPGCLNVLANQM